ncbi:unnamed protein product, partial [Hapterophycus canaliculatus]
QRITAVSTTVSEYMPMGDGVKEVVKAKRVPYFLVPELTEWCFHVFVDNAGANSLVINPLNSATTKNIDLRFPFTRELTRSRPISMVYVPTTDQNADTLLKGTLLVKH